MVFTLWEVDLAYGELKFTGIVRAKTEDDAINYIKKEIQKGWYLVNPSEAEASKWEIPNVDNPVTLIDMPSKEQYRIAINS